MTDLRAEAALDAELGPPNDKFFEWFVDTCRRQGCLPSLARLFNIGSLPEENKVIKSPDKKRKYKPKHSPKIQALKKKEIKEKTKYEKTKKELQFETSTERVKNILDRIEKDKNKLEKAVAFMEKKNIDIDKDDKERMATTSREIDKIKNKINEINKKAASKKISMDRQIKEWETKEEQANTKMKKSIEEMENKLVAIKEEIKQRIQVVTQHEAEEKDRIDREIHNIIDAESKEEKDIQNNIEAKKNTLAMINLERKKNIQKKKEEEAETIARIDLALKKSKDDELKMKKKIDINIAAKRTTIAEIKKKMEKKLKDMKRTEQEKIQKIQDLEAVEKKKAEEKLKYTKEQSEKQIRAMELHQAERKREIDAEIRHLLEKAMQEARIAKHFAIMQKTLAESNKELEKNIQVIQQLESKTQSQIEEIQTLKEKENQAKIDQDKNITFWKNSLTINKHQIEKNIEPIQITNIKELNNSLESMRQHETKNTREIQGEIQRSNENKSAKKDNIKKNIEALPNSLAMSEEEFETDIIEVLRQQEEEKKNEFQKTKHQAINDIKAQKKDNIEALRKKLSARAAKRSSLLPDHRSVSTLKP